MRIRFRGNIRVRLGTDVVQLDVPRRGMRLRDVVLSIQANFPATARYLDDLLLPATVRVIVNGTIVSAGENPLLFYDDDLMFLGAVAGGL